MAFKESLLRLAGQSGDEGLPGVTQAQAEELGRELLIGNDRLGLAKVPLSGLSWSNSVKLFATPSTSLPKAVP